MVLAGAEHVLPQATAEFEQESVGSVNHGEGFFDLLRLFSIWRSNGPRQAPAGW